MGPKKAAAAPVVEASRTQAFSEVEKAMFELQIADLNRKLARLRAANTDYELRNEELQKAYDKLDEDRADIIAYLKKTLNIKTEENSELKDRVKGLEELREVETAEFNEKVTELEKNFTTMKDQLTSENKLLAGKLNTLEEFRAIREDLMKKFEKQEQDFVDQEMKYKRVIYNAEKKFVIGKDKLKKEMEGRLLNLAQDFQDASETRIAASTHRVIRENIALNNQLDNLLYTQAKVAEQNEKYKEDERNARNALEVAEAERDKAINKSIVQLKVIDQLTTAFQTAQKNQALHDKRVFDFENLNEKIKKLTNENENMRLQIRILEQNLHAKLGENNKYVAEKAKLLKERDKYKQVIKETTMAIQAALKKDQWDVTDPKREVEERKEVLNCIINVINKHTQAIGAESTESLISLRKVYEMGDLGFIPKPAAGSLKKKQLSVTSQSQKSMEQKGSYDKTSESKPSLGSLKSVPSISIIAPADEISKSSMESIPSFTVTSLHSSVEEEEELEEKDSLADKSDIAKQLELSKLEIQKSILKDLALSQTTFRSRSRVDFTDQSKSKLSIIDSKQALITEDTEKQDSILGQTEETGEDRDEITNENTEVVDSESTERQVDENVDDEDKNSADAEKDIYKSAVDAEESKNE